MIAAADADEAPPAIDFIRLVRNVADARKVSVHDILTPAPRITYYVHPKTGELTERIQFDQQAGWSWREVLAWGNDAARAAAEQRSASAKADWQRQSELPNYDEYCES